MLIDLSHLSKIPGKRVLEHGGHQSCSHTPNFKRLKVDAIRQFPRVSRAKAPAINERSEDVINNATTPNLKNQVEMAVVPVKPTEISATTEWEYETKKVTSSCDKVEAFGQKMTPNNVGMRLPKGSEKDGYINVLENDAQPNKQINALVSLETLSPLPLHVEKYPPPKIRKGVPVYRKFPIHCGKINHDNNVEMKLPKALKKDELTNVLESGAQPKQIDGSSSLETLSSPQAVSDDLSIIPIDNYQSVVSRNKVMETVNLFKEITEKLSQERQPNSKSEGKGAGRIYLEAAMVLKKQQKWVNTSERILGPVPGVEVGDQFRFRVELFIIGLHQQFVAGIDYMKKDKKIFATSIVASGRYGNHAETSDVLIYSGQGGNPKVMNKKPEDQKLERGNLALKNSMDARTPVRVIIGRKQNLRESNMKGTSNERIEKTYIYDGLYLVTKYWQERKEYGKLVYMFQLNRLPGQPKQVWQIVNKSKESEVHKEYCVASDISQGKEKTPINALIAKDGEKPPPFNYITNMIYPELYNHSSPVGCDCINGCSDTTKCSCTIKNGGEIPFNNNGAIIRAKPIVHECGPSCKCPPSCKNRVTQHGIRHQLEVFKTELRGWGVRTRNFISSGSFICEYVGELLRDTEAEKRTGNDEYLFDIGVDYDDHILQDEDDDGYTIDAAHHGNVGRFINHSCSPNLYGQNVLYDHDDKRMCHVMLFATRNIQPLQELTYDYNYKVDQVHDANGNIKKKKCHCGSRKCTGRMY